MFTPRPQLPVIPAKARIHLAFKVKMGTRFRGCDGISSAVELPLDE
jgi:hypothetical protein